jgi:hypothetical protein
LVKDVGPGSQAGFAVYADLPILRKEELPSINSPVLCVAGRTALDEAAAIMFAQLCNVHGLRMRVERTGIVVH